MFCFFYLEFENIFLLIIDYSGVIGKLDFIVVMLNGEKLIYSILGNYSFICIVFVN